MDYLFHLKKGWHKASFYAGNFGAYLLPRAFFQKQAASLLASALPAEREAIMKRASYYNRLPTLQTERYDTGNWTSLGDFRYPFGSKKKYSTYFFDLYRTARYFPPSYKMAFRFGDITEEAAEPAFVKSRPITEGATNSVVLKLNEARHYFFWHDKLAFRDKRDMMVGRNIVRQPHRARLLETCFSHPLCDIGQVNTDTNREHPEWVKAFLPIPAQLKYKFVACIEGNDVATNLKWVMASNSIAVMPRPRYETWFMEGTLIPDYHYVEVRDDYADLPEKLAHYIKNPEEAERIIEHAHKHVQAFLNPRLERLVSLMVMDIYFKRTGQKAQYP